ncbi:MAG TPA: phosphotransferase enzyme family protein [Candidatus Marinimicrobia bacterium]|nr:phosphotransferase enzyme family protein [Candidatus Neomarinimicrobiota bacterium]
MEIHTEQELIRLFEDWSGENVVTIQPLPPSGSYREYYRIKGTTRTAIGAYNSDKKENRAFTEFTKHFHSLGLNVPALYRENLAENIYLVEDLGDTTLYTYINQNRSGKSYPDRLIDIYKSVIEQLPKFQINAGKNLDYSLCYPRSCFDKRSMMWDLNYFKYYFLKLAQIPFDEQDLEEDFQTLTDYLLQAGTEYFLYRDFQSRNVMLKNGKPFFIDYQGGRRGALQYDLASLLYDSKADMPVEVRKILLEHYISIVSKEIDIQPEEFTRYFYGYVLIRIMQAMGSYGFRGFYEKKEHFLQSIPYALANLATILENVQLPIEIPALWGALQKVVRSKRLQKISTSQKTLTITVNSFSYKRGIPIDVSGHGGGFVFDCRAIHNPGRYEKYAGLTGKDKPVIDFLDKENGIKSFLANVYNLIDQSVEKYLQRNFTNLMVSFGCTGGQHRSVYCAEALAEHLKNKFNIRLVLRHLELDMNNNPELDLE